jgi:thiosulfate/3-mercaptopyruvate sulfurtransferase
MEKKLPPLVGTSEVNLLIDNPEVVIVDARGGMGSFDQYNRGHLKGALYIDLENELSEKTSDAAEGGRHPLPEVARFGDVLGKFGIRPSTRVIVYDDKNGANAAARFWWMMRAAGHVAVQVINGGYASIVKAGLPVSQTVSVRTSADPYPISAWKLPRVDIQLVDRKRTDPEYVVLDVREAYRYRGESEPIDLVAGHIPGAINLPYVNNLDADGHFKDDDALRRQFAEVIGARDVKNVIVHCGSGVTACHMLLALEQAGLPGASLYVGSWSEWSRNQKPIATGASAAGNATFTV